MRSNKPSSKKSGSRQGSNSQKKPVHITPEAFSALAKHVQSQAKAMELMRRERTPPGPGALSSLGGHADAILAHGQEAWEEIKKFLNVEEKQLLTAVASSTFGYTGAVVDIDSIVQGVADNQRTGDSVKCMYLNVRYTVRQHLSATIPTVVRIMVVQSVDEDVTALDINAYDASVYAVNGGVNWDTRKQYRILYDHTTYAWYYSLNGTIHKDVHIKLGTHIQYQHGVTTVEKGALQIFLWSDDDTWKPSFTAVAELVYVDN